MLFAASILAFTIPKEAHGASVPKRWAVVASHLRPLIGNRVVLGIHPLAGSVNYVCLAGQYADDEGPGGSKRYDSLELLLVHNSPKSAELLSTRVVGPPESKFMGGIDAEFRTVPTTAKLSLVPATSDRQSWFAVVYRCFNSGDCSPALINLAPVAPTGIGKLYEFGTLTQESGVSSPLKMHGLVVSAAPTFKVWWQDSYEWNGRGFVLANARHPEIYSESNYNWSASECDDYYPMWMNKAAIRDIKRQYPSALKAWKRAEKACLNTLRYGPTSRYRDVGFYGEAKVNLVEIRQRIEWLKERDYAHALLYRPYDFDLQVPPYRLGKAHGAQYG